MLKFSEQDDDHLTWANLWVNSNYRYFLNNISLIERFVELNFDKIIKSNVVRRYGIKIYDLCVNFFLGSSETN